MEHQTRPLGGETLKNSCETPYSCVRSNIRIQKGHFFFYIFYLLDSQENYQCPKLFNIKIRPCQHLTGYFEKQRFFPSVFKKQSSSTRSVFKSFSLLHMKRHKMMDFEIYDSILYRACIMLVVI